MFRRQKVLIFVIIKSTCCCVLRYNILQTNNNVSIHAEQHIQIFSVTFQLSWKHSDVKSETDFLIFTVFATGIYELNPSLKRFPHILEFKNLLTVHLSISISVINQLDAQNVCFTISLFHISTCFEHMYSSPGGQNCITQSLVSSYL